MTKVLEAILQFIEAALGWIVDFFEWAVTRFFVMLFDAIVAVLSFIPVPDWLTQLESSAVSIDPGVLYFLQPMAIDTGLAWIVSAYLLRFCIRRLPVIG